MKKVFKASILAASVAFAFAANAASVTPTAQYKLSEEGLAVGNTSAETVLTFDVVVTKEHAATTEIVLTFSDTVDLNGLADGACGVVNNGVFTCGDVTFNVGTGNFTFDNVAIDEDENTLTFKVSLGNALSANSAFRITLDGATDAIFTGASTVAYKSTFGGNTVETGSSVLSTVEKQFKVAVSTQLEKVIERKERVEFVEDPATDTDTFAIKVTNNDALLAAADFEDLQVKLYGNFARKTTPAPGVAVHTNKWTLADRAAPVVGVTGTVAADGKSISFNYNPATQVVPTAAGISYDVNFAGAGIVIDPSDFSVDISVDYSNGAAETGVAKVAVGADAGEWELDAAVVNVPYLPINYGLSSNIEVANHGSSDAEIMAEGFDQNGKVYDSVVVKTIKGKTMGKISEGDLKTAFGIAADAQVKLNVTFVIDQDSDKVTLVPYYKEGQSRINVMSDQYKADNIR